MESRGLAAMYRLHPTHWNTLQNFQARSFKCGFCDNRVGSEKGYFYNDSDRRVNAFVFICPVCGNPSYFDISGSQVPGVLIGDPVENVPSTVETLYQEVRKSAGAEANTASVMAARKILMNIAVDKGAPAGKSFSEYVEFLADKGYVPPDGKGWVKHIKDKGNEANHEIKIMSKEDAEELITFIHMLLTLIYAFPARLPKKTP
jgi:hypothetical protein